jgi:hypothetical protein
MELFAIMLNAAQVAIYLMATGIIGLWPRSLHHIPH